MAEKKSSGFKTFLLIFIVAVLAVFLGLGAFLILVPDSKIFGIRYLSNTKTETVWKVEGSSSEFLYFKDYSKVVVNVADGTGHTNVSVNCGEPDNRASSQIVLKEGTKGFARYNEDALTEYEMTISASGGTLTINISEPKYDFIQLSNNTVLSLNVYSLYDSVDNVNIEINTGGNVTLGGLVNSADVGRECKIGSVAVNTVGGSITMTERASVSGDAVLSTKTGKVTLLGDKTLANLTMESKGGKIIADKITANVAINTYNSRVSLGDVTGNISLNMESGILDLKNVFGDLTANNTIKFTSVSVGTVSGKTTLVNDDGNFSVDIKKCEGSTLIQSGNKGVTIGEVCGICEITTTGGNVDVAKLSTNSSDLLIQTQGGSVNLKFVDENNKYSDVLGSVNTVSTKTGSINVTFGGSAHFVLNASSPNGKVYREWLDSDQNPVENDKVGSDSATTNALGLQSESGKITLKQKYN